MVNCHVLVRSYSRCLHSPSFVGRLIPLLRMSTVQYLSVCTSITPLSVQPNAWVCLKIGYAPMALSIIILI